MRIATHIQLTPVPLDYVPYLLSASNLAIPQEQDVDSGTFQLSTPEIPLPGGVAKDSESANGTAFEAVGEN